MWTLFVEKPSSVYSLKFLVRDGPLRLAQWGSTLILARGWDELSQASNRSCCFLVGPSPRASAGQCEEHDGLLGSLPRILSTTVMTMYMMPLCHLLLTCEKGSIPEKWQKTQKRRSAWVDVPAGPQNENRRIMIPIGLYCIQRLEIFSQFYSPVFAF